MTQPTAYAIVYRNPDGTYRITPDLHKTRDCAIESIPALEGSTVAGIAEVCIETTPVSGLQYRLDHCGREAEPE